MTSSRSTRVVSLFPGCQQDAGLLPFRTSGDSVAKPPVVGIATSPGAQGYWLATSDGRISAYGAAHSYGSMAGKQLNQPVVAVTTDPKTGGYWEVASDGGVFAFHAPFRGSTGNIQLHAPITGMAPTPSGHGYRLVAGDGGVFDFGDAHYYGRARY